MSAAKPGTLLRNTDLCNAQQLELLAALSITTCEELIAFAENEIEFFRSFLEVPNMMNFLNRARELATEAITDQESETFNQIRYTYGATGGAKIPAQLDKDFLPLPSFLAMPKQEVNLQNYFGFVRNQGARNTCVAFAVVAARECLLKKQSNNGTDLSEQYLYYRCKESDGTLSTAYKNVKGTSLSTAIPLIRDIGVCEESIWPYNPSNKSGNEGQGPPPSGVDAAAGAYRINTAPSNQANLVDDILAQLSQELPVVVSVGIYPYGNADTFSATVVKKYGNIPMPLPGRNPIDEHAICLAGYKIVPGGDYAGGGYFIVRNSWGRKWGTNSSLGRGYGKIPFNYIKNYCTGAFSLV